MGQKGLDFKHKEVINIKDGRRLRICSRCVCGFTIRKHYFYNGYLIENKYMSYILERECEKKSYITKKNQSRTGYVLKEN